MWRRLAPPRTKEFFAKLDWMQGGTDLWKYLEPLSPAILTGSPSGDWAGPQKVRWCQKNLQLSANRVLVVDPCDKALFSHPGAILVDDRAEYRADWEARGGIFVHFKEATVRLQGEAGPAEALLLWCFASRTWSSGSHNALLMVHTAPLSISSVRGSRAGLVANLCARLYTEMFHTMRIPRTSHAGSDVAQSVWW
ncbi:Hypothetical protein SCF082_LOCUS6752, partial [Durusdinium trenchii]